MCTRSMRSGKIPVRGESDAHDIFGADFLVGMGNPPAYMPNARISFNSERVGSRFPIGIDAKINECGDLLHNFRPQNQRI